MTEEGDPMLSFVLTVLAAPYAGDWHEPDDTPAMAAQAPALYHDVAAQPIHLGLVAGPGDDDWFRVYADCCSRIDARLAWFGPPKALTFDVFDAEGRQVSDERVSTHRRGGFIHLRIDDAGGHWLVRVHNTTDVQQPYDLHVLAPVLAP
ncbi:MAG TPA: hypothetical protein PKA64_19785 [Myxococcota bacterium]|nr:hypothetical protein [Myxococcota bacterium]